MTRSFNFLFLLLLAALVPSFSKRTQQLPVIDKLAPGSSTEEPAVHTVVSPIPPLPTIIPAIEKAGSLTSKTSADMVPKTGKRTAMGKTRSKDGGIGGVESASSGAAPPSTGDDIVTSYDDDYDGQGGQAVDTNTTNTTIG